MSRRERSPHRCPLRINPTRKNSMETTTRMDRSCWSMLTTKEDSERMDRRSELLAAGPIRKPHPGQSTGSRQGLCVALHNKKGLNNYASLPTGNTVRTYTYNNNPVCRRVMKRISKPVSSYRARLKRPFLHSSKTRQTALLSPINRVPRHPLPKDSAVLSASSFMVLKENTNNLRAVYIPAA
jgi:hypothetical protein